MVKKARFEGLGLLLLGSLVFILLVAVLENAAPAPMTDFKPLYYPARSLIEHHDPYLQSDVSRIYQAEAESRPAESEAEHQIATQTVYLPTAFSLSVPFAMLPWAQARILWMMLTMGSLIFASFLVWDLGADYEPILSGGMIAFLLANSGFLIISGNAAGIAVSLCVAAVWCFLRERFVPAGILCLAVSLAVKPHDAGLVWLFFLLAGRVYRKRALQTLFLMVILTLPVVLWVWHVSPHWMQELHSNLLAYSAHGGTNDPGVAAIGPKGAISLQTVISFFRDDPRIYNPVSYLVCAPLLLVWAIVVLRSRSSPARTWLALAAISAFTVLPVYHRQYDAKIVMLTVPACALLWAESGLMGKLATLLNAAMLTVTADVPWIFILGLLHDLHVGITGVLGHTLRVVLVSSTPLILLFTGAFYLWAYARRSHSDSGPNSCAIEQHIDKAG